MSNAQVLIDSYQLYTHKQLQAAAKSLNVIDSVQATFIVIAEHADFKKKTYSSYLKYDTLIKKTGQCKRTLQRHVKKLSDLGVLKVTKTGYICKRTGQRRQSNNVYTFMVDTIKSLVCHSHKSPLITFTHKQKDIDLDSVSKVKQEAKAVYQRLSTAARFKDFKTAWVNRGKRYIDEVTGGIFIHSSHKTKPSMLIGYVLGSPAHQNAELMMKECQKILK